MTKRLNMDPFLISANKNKTYFIYPIWYALEVAKVVVLRQLPA